MTKTDQEKQLVVQSNPLVQGQYKLGLLPQILIRKLVSMIRPADDQLEKVYYRFYVRDFAELIGREDHDVIIDVIKAAKKLKSTPIKVIKPKSVLETSWIASFEYHKGEGWIEFEFSSKLETELLKIKEQFTQYYLKNISQFKSQYSIRIYELLRQYIGLGLREIKLDELKKILGIAEGEYHQFGHLRSRVLEPSRQEINKKTDIEFKWKPKKHVRKIVAIEFYDIKNKIVIPETLLAVLPRELRENKDVIKNIRKYLELNGFDYVKQKIQYSNSQKPGKWPQYFAAALHNDYGADYQPAQPYLPFAEGENVGIDIKDGMKIEIDGVSYAVEDGYIRQSGGVIPSGQIKQLIASGEAKIISGDNAP